MYKYDLFKSNKWDHLYDLSNPDEAAENIQASLDAISQRTVPLGSRKNRLLDTLPGSRVTLLVL